jgi:hypothetical protein
MWRCSYHSLPDRMIRLDPRKTFSLGFQPLFRQPWLLVKIDLDSLATEKSETPAIQLDTLQRLAQRTAAHTWLPLLSIFALAALPGQTGASPTSRHMLTTTRRHRSAVDRVTEETWLQTTPRSRDNRQG